MTVAWHQVPDLMKGADVPNSLNGSPLKALSPDPASVLQVFSGPHPEDKMRSQPFESLVGCPVFFSGGYW